MGHCVVFPPHAAQYGAIDTYPAAASWLDGNGDVYDWGCGQRFAEKFFTRSRYFGLDGTFGTGRKVDLATVEIDCENILMRHVLDCNPDTWRKILTNSLASFRRRMALVTFTEFADETHIYKAEEYATGPLHYLQFRKADLTDLMGPLLVRDYPMQTTHPEHLFLLEKR